MIEMDHAAGRVEHLLVVGRDQAGHADRMEGAQRVERIDPKRVRVTVDLDYAPIAPEQIKGMNYAISEFGGSVAGRKIEMIVEDTGGAPATGWTCGSRCF
mgnify:CR=1 FL=1